MKAILSKMLEMALATTTTPMATAMRVSGSGTSVIGEGALSKMIKLK